MTAFNANDREESTFVGNDRETSFVGNDREDSTFVGNDREVTEQTAFAANDREKTETFMANDRTAFSPKLD